MDIDNFFLTTDLHLTDKVRDEYRWGLFEWIVDTCRKAGISTVFVLGDVTDLKDNHSSRLVNLVVESFSMLAEEVGEVIILQGNHDYLLKDNPYFKFLNFKKNIRFIDKITTLGNQVLLLPHTRTPLDDWGKLNFNKYRYIFMHQTVTGSIASNGQAMSGDFDEIKTSSTVYSGDIHVPQVVGNVTYVGSPYHVHSGDRFKPRCICVQNSIPKDVHFKTIEKFTATISSPEELEELNIKPKDQLKIKLDLPPSMRNEWANSKKEIQDWCIKNGVDLQGLELLATKRKRVQLNDTASTQTAAIKGPADALQRFAKIESISNDTLNTGLAIINETPYTKTSKF